VNETKTKSRACGALWCWESDPSTGTETGLKTRRQLEQGRPESTRAQTWRRPARADETVTESVQRIEKLGEARHAKPRLASVCYCPKTKIPKTERSGRTEDREQKITRDKELLGAVLARTKSGKLRAGEKEDRWRTRGSRWQTSFGENGISRRRTSTGPTLYTRAEEQPARWHRKDLLWLFRRPGHFAHSRKRRFENCACGQLKSS
jgi:hypothetical protein